MELDKDLIKSIDDLLNELFQEGHTSWHSDTSESKRKAIRTCNALNLIRTKSDSTFELDEKGVLAIQDGGIEKYLSYIRTEKDLNMAIKVLTSRRLKYGIWYNVMYVLIGGIIGLIPALTLPDNSEKHIEETHKLPKKKNELYETSQKEMNEMKNSIIELESEIDSLKN